MATFLDTTGGSYHLEQIIKGAAERLVLISPYLRTNDRIREFLDDRERLKIDIRVVYGKTDLAPDEMGWLRSKTGIRTSFCKNLHAKCYVNEKVALITSMNLYDFSQANNNEMGILVERDKEPELYGAIWAEVQRLIRISEEIRVSVERVPAEQSPADSKREKRESGTPAAIKVPEQGFCIGCRATLPMDPTHPYCRACYTAWKATKDDKREEKHCHVCGGANKSSLARPACYECYRKYKGKLAFAD
jgi:phosphatidylserine/phosphatidylglycerophosphate/cardiolipin synthase-like enzyme